MHAYYYILHFLYIPKEIIFMYLLSLLGNYMHRKQVVIVAVLDIDSYSDIAKWSYMVAQNEEMHIQGQTQIPA